MSQDSFGVNASILHESDADSMLSGSVAMHPAILLSGGSFASQIATDSSGAQWIADAALKQILFQLGAQSNGHKIFLQLSYVPQGIAVDSVRGLIYVSDTAGNAIDVYNATGQRIALIK